MKASNDYWRSVQIKSWWLATVSDNGWKQEFPTIETVVEINCGSNQCYQNEREKDY